MSTTVAMAKMVGQIAREYRVKFLSKEQMWAPLRRLLPYMWKCRHSYGVLGGTMLCNVFISLYVARFLQTFTNAAIGHELSTVSSMLFTGIAIVVVYSILMFSETYFKDVVINRIQTDVQNDVFHRALLMETSRLDTYRHSDIVVRLTYDIRRIGSAVGMNILHAFRLVLTAIGALVYLLMISWKLTLVAVCIVPPAVFATMVISKFMRVNSTQISEAISEQHALLQESMSGVTVIRSFNLEQHFLQRFKATTNKILNLQLQNSVLRGTVSVGGGLVHFVSYLVSFTVGALYIERGIITVGDLVAFMTLMQHLVGPMMSAPRELGSYQAGMAATTRIWNIMDEQAEAPAFQPPNETNQNGDNKVTVRLDRVSFRYPLGQQALNDVSILAPHGQTTALVGPSGAGKSTLFRLLLGLYMPDAGHIYIDGSLTTSLTPSFIRSLIAYVPQETFLFHGTIRDNIRHGRLDATDEQIHRAAIDANADEFIKTLPYKYDTIIGPQGIQLSGGQRQRIAIARAILKDAPILLLDEATSALDAESESAIQNALARLMANKTTLIIAHRLSTIMSADSIYVLDKGRVIESGSHDQLLQNRSLYARLHGMQFRSSQLPTE